MRDWAELILDALREIRAHKLRSLLTLSGIVFGAASVVSMTSLASAMQTLVYDDLIAMGLSRSFFMDDEGPRSDAKGASALRHTGLRLTDLEALRALPGVASVHGRNWGQEQVVNAPADRRQEEFDLEELQGEARRQREEKLRRVLEAKAKRQARTVAAL